MSDTDPEDFHELIGEATTVSMPSLTVTVDFNQLLFDTSEERAFRLIGALKDLLS